MLRDRLNTALKEAMKSGDAARVSAVRLMNAKIKEKDIDARPKGNATGITDDEILSLLQSMIKQRQESIALYKQGNRQDLVDKEQAEIDVINAFLPQQLSDVDMKARIQEEIAAAGATSVKDMGKVIAALKSKYAGQMDMGKASGLVKTLLSGAAA